MRLFRCLQYNSKLYGVLNQVRESSPSFIQSLLPTKKLYNLGACFEVVDLVSRVFCFCCLCFLLPSFDLLMWEGEVVWLNKKSYV